MMTINTINRDIIFYSDSQATIKSIEKPKVSSQTIIDCIYALNELATNNRVTINWIPGHRGYIGNETADQLAKFGTVSSNKIHHIKPPHKTLLLRIKQYFKNIHYMRWQYNPLNEDCTYPINTALAACDNQMIRLSRAILKLSTKNTSIITRFLTGHNVLNKHLHRTNFAPEPTCEYCPPENRKPYTGDFPEETACHIVENCPAFAQDRMKYFEIDFYTNIVDIFNRKNKSVHQSLKDIAEFLKATGCMSRQMKFSKPISPNRTIKQRKRIKTIKKQPQIQANKITRYFTDLWIPRHKRDYLAPTYHTSTDKLISRQVLGFLPFYAQHQFILEGNICTGVVALSHFIYHTNGPALIAGPRCWQNLNMLCGNLFPHCGLDSTRVWRKPA